MNSWFDSQLNYPPLISMFHSRKNNTAINTFPNRYIIPNTAQKIQFSIKDFFSKCDQIRWKLRIWSHLLKKFLMENLIFVQ